MRTVRQRCELLFYDDFDGGQSSAWQVESGTWSADGLSYCQTEDALPGMSRTVEAYTWIGGFTLTAKTRLVDRLSWCGRDIGWVFDDDSNAVRIGYVGHLLRIECHCRVGGEHVYFGTHTVSYDEWTGADGLEHFLSVEIADDVLTGWRDGELIFQVVDHRLLNLPNSGYAYVLTWGSRSCFDDVAAWSLYNDPVEGSTWGAVKALYLP